MKLHRWHKRALLVALAMVGLALFFTVTGGALLQVGAAFVGLTPYEWTLIGLSCALLLSGHVLRAARTKVPTDNVRRGSLSSHFQALAVGYYFDTVLPFRLGEIVRSFLIARKLRISFLYTLTAVALERLLDIVLVSTMFLIVAVVVGALTLVPITAAIASSVAVIVVAMFVMVVRENRFLLQVVWRITALLNARLEARARFTIWAVIFGFQRLLRDKRQLAKYGTLLILSWAAYIGAATVLSTTFLPRLSGPDGIIAALAPHSVTSMSAGIGDPGSFIAELAQTLDFVVPVEAVQRFGGIAWTVLIVPIAFIGLLLVFRVTTQPRAEHEVLGTGTASAHGNKLVRLNDISATMPHFLDSYFRGHQLSQVVHRLEVAGHMQLLRFFKGGSNAITVLAQTGSDQFVRKLVPKEYEHRLRNQYEWLKVHAQKSKIVAALREERTDSYYAIDLEYRPGSVALFEYLHVNSLEASQLKLAEIWEYMYDHVYELEAADVHEPERDLYVEDRLVSRVYAAATLHEGLNEALGSPHLVVNGQVLENFDQVLKRIKEHSVAWNDISIYQQSRAIHGDLTVDNVLIDRDRDEVLIIDPSDDNQIRGPVMDFARHLQSLEYGYEFLNEDETVTKVQHSDEGMPMIFYADKRSARYAELADFVTTELMPRHLTAPEQRAVLFHVGLFYARMLPHRIVINPDNAVKYYAVAVEAFNRFMEQYTRGERA